MEAYGGVRRRMEAYGGVWRLMEAYGAVWRLMGTYGRVFFFFFCLFRRSSRGQLWLQGLSYLRLTVLGARQGRRERGHRNMGPALFQRVDGAPIKDQGLTGLATSTTGCR